MQAISRLHYQLYYCIISLSDVEWQKHAVDLEALRQFRWMYAQPYDFDQLSCQIFYCTVDHHYVFHFHNSHWLCEVICYSGGVDMIITRICYQKMLQNRYITKEQKIALVSAVIALPDPHGIFYYIPSGCHCCHLNNVYLYTTYQYKIAEYCSFSEVCLYLKITSFRLLVWGVTRNISHRNSHCLEYPNLWIIQSTALSMSIPINKHNQVWLALTSCVPVVWLRDYKAKLKMGIKWEYYQEHGYGLSALCLNFAWQYIRRYSVYKFQTEL